MNNPEEHFLWALVGLPGPDNVAPLLLPVPATRAWSKRLWDCGFRHHPELQTAKYSPPPGDHNWLLGPAGSWIGSDEEPVEPVTPSLENVTMSEKRALFELLKAELAEFEVEDKDTARVVRDDESE